MSSEWLESEGRTVAIRVRNVSKHYAMFQRPEDRFKQMVVPRLERLIGRPSRRYFRDFAALSNVSFDIGRGETVGIIGRNGSGKSTLLQIICGTLQSTSGSVEVDGRIAALLELGAGFNPEFTGRENVFLNSSILGIPRKEMEWRFDDIARFADIGPFIDQPVKTYSSGMYVRLAFATAINVDPDILVVDEALAVGDEAFQRKCFARIEQIKERGGTVLFVSHAAQAIVQLCTRAMLIDNGELILQGVPKRVIGQYQRLVNLNGEEGLSIRKQIVEMGEATIGNREESHPSDAPGQEASQLHHIDESWHDPSLTSHSRVEYESQGAEISRLRIIASDGREVNVLVHGEKYTYQYDVLFSEDIYNFGFGMLINTRSGLGIAGIGKGTSGSPAIKKVNRGSRIKVSIDFVTNLLPGVYFLNAGITGATSSGGGFVHRIIDGLAFRIAPVADLEATGLVDLGVAGRYQLID
ncbi:ABC transporter ATP-binding protein [Mesorhizobium sp.]|uniref:ABC transporter ATP-binding protein n=1 Tax=Mesorhizobium sp. TaxID=1871066 RepID=UPI0012053470|nr:ABC transporter ATP-binding protein [Mesorhizobium sp.]TIV54504.1 MAG: ABC transporter ATP-binding protein [Mesorhizobium sp.]